MKEDPGFCSCYLNIYFLSYKAVLIIFPFLKREHIKSSHECVCS
uniref:Uncharacterized protein n=1 Tax=Lepeophtheirus salmonis TaxID=72036 RepID=A0A0K2V867_LEPSM